jgi:hypothetical protein
VLHSGPTCGATCSADEVWSVGNMEIGGFCLSIILLGFVKFVKLVVN